MTSKKSVDSLKVRNKGILELGGKEKDKELLNVRR